MVKTIVMVADYKKYGYEKGQELKVYNSLYEELVEVQKVAKLKKVTKIKNGDK
jgi:hypothetical protein